MSNEQQTDNLTSKRAWGAGGPRTAAHRKEAKSLFLDHLKATHNVSFACEYAAISRDTAYRWQKEDQQFADDWASTVERSRDIARASIYQRGILGWDEPMVSMGQIVYEMIPVLDADGEQVFDRGKPKMRRGDPMTVHKWSDSLAALYAKSNLPEYREKPQVSIHAQMADLAEQAKNELLADLESAIANEDKNPTHQE